MTNLIFLGGTVGNNNWRSEFTANLISLGFSSNEIFNPVVSDWNEEAQKREEEAKKNATHFIFYIASPQQEGNSLSAYSMVEAAMALYDEPETTVVIFDTIGMDGHALKAMNQTAKVLKNRFPKGNIFTSTKEALVWFSKL